jgi:hypothetical protein
MKRNQRARPALWSFWSFCHFLQLFEAVELGVPPSCSVFFELKPRISNETLCSRFFRFPNGSRHQTYFELFLRCKFRSYALVLISSLRQSDGGGDARNAAAAAAAAVCHIAVTR